MAKTKSDKNSTSGFATAASGRRSQAVFRTRFLQKARRSPRKRTSSRTSSRRRRTRSASGRAAVLASVQWPQRRRRAPARRMRRSGEGRRVRARRPAAGSSATGPRSRPGHQALVQWRSLSGFSRLAATPALRSNPLSTYPSLSERLLREAFHFSGRFGVTGLPLAHVHLGLLREHLDLGGLGAEHGDRDPDRGDDECRRRSGRRAGSRR